LSHSPFTPLTLSLALSLDSASLHRASFGRLVRTNVLPFYRDRAYAYTWADAVNIVHETVTSGATVVRRLFPVFFDCSGDLFMSAVG